MSWHFTVNFDGLYQECKIGLSKVDNFFTIHNKLMSKLLQWYFHPNSLNPSGELKKKQVSRFKSKYSMCNGSKIWVRFFPLFLLVDMATESGLSFSMVITLQFSISNCQFTLLFLPKRTTKTLVTKQWLCSALIKNWMTCMTVSWDRRQAKGAFTH